MRRKRCSTKGSGLPQWCHQPGGTGYGWRHHLEPKTCRGAPYRFDTRHHSGKGQVGYQYGRRSNVWLIKPMGRKSQCTAYREMTVL